MIESVNSVRTSFAQPVVDSAATYEFSKIILSHAGRYISSSINGKIGSPRYCEVEAYVGWLFVMEFRTPKLVGGYCSAV